MSSGGIMDEFGEKSIERILQLSENLTKREYRMHPPIWAAAFYKELGEKEKAVKMVLI